MNKLFLSDMELVMPLHQQSISVTLTLAN